MGSYNANLTYCMCISAYNTKIVFLMYSTQSILVPLLTATNEVHCKQLSFAKMLKEHNIWELNVCNTSKYNTISFFLFIQCTLKVVFCHSLAEK